MSSTATVSLSLQYTPPSAAANSGNVSFQTQTSHNAQNVGNIDVNPADPTLTEFPVPFGAVGQAKVLVIKNLMTSDIGVRINGGVPVSTGVKTGASITTVLGSLATITGLTGMSASDVGGTLQLAGAASPGNNGTFVIAAYISATSVSITNYTAVAADANNPNIYWEKVVMGNNFKIPTGGEVVTASATSPSGEPITSASIVTTAAPAVIESIQHFVFGD